MLFCCIEQGEVTSWSDTENIAQIQHAHAQRQYLLRLQTILKNFGKNQLAQKGRKSMPCVTIMTTLVTFQSIMTPKVSFMDTYIALALLSMVKSVFTVLRIVILNIQKMINSGHGRQGYIAA